jgi:hypothetical protein
MARAVSIEVIRMTRAKLTLLSKSDIVGRKSEQSSMDIIQCLTS